MKKAVVVLFVFILAVAGSVFAFRNQASTTLQQKIGDIRPAFLAAGSPQPQAPDQKVTGQAADNRLKVPEGYQATIFSAEASGARDLQFSPNGTLLVSLRTPGKVIALPDQDGDGVADRVVEVLSGLKSPHGLAFYQGKLFVAEERQLNRYVWDETNLTAKLDKKLLDLPSGGSGHFTRSLVFDQAGNLYISIGSTCNVCEQPNPWNGAVIITDQEGSTPRIFAQGLRNAVFLTIHPTTDKVWVTDMGRDLLGDNIPPEEVNILQDNGNYGWPYCYGNKIYDKQFGKQTPEYCVSTLSPTFEMQAHSAPLGLTFIDSEQFPADWQGDLLVAFHGSWNRSIPTGYKVVRLDVDGETITEQSDFMTGFLQGSQSIGRPVDVTFDAQGRLYVSDDKVGTVYLISKTSP